MLPFLRLSASEKELSSFQKKLSFFFKTLCFFIKTLRALCEKMSKNEEKSCTDTQGLCNFLLFLTIVNSPTTVTRC